MTYQEAIEILQEEHDYCQETSYVIKALEMAIEALEKEIPEKPCKDNENGVYEKEHCPSCHRSLFPNDHHCECGQAIDWEVSE